MLEVGGRCETLDPLREYMKTFFRSSPLTNLFRAVVQGFAWFTVNLHSINLLHHLISS